MTQENKAIQHTPDDMITGRFIRKSDTDQERIQSFAFVIGVLLCVLFSFGFVSNLVGLGLAVEGREFVLESRINPNNAPAASLIRLPGIGISRAQAIVAYREQFVGQGGSGAAFRVCDDLQKIKGIGPKTAEKISEWLKFE